MRRIGISTCCALMMVLTLFAPASAQVLDFATLTSQGPQPPCYVISTLRVTSWAFTVSGLPFLMAS